MVIKCGIDEAGRGPVIGPLVIAGVCLAEEKEDLFRERGVKDSKLLSQAQRVALTEFIKKEVESFEILIVDVDEIDAAVESEDPMVNLNWLEADKAVEIIKKLNATTVILDCPSTVPEKFKAYVQERLNPNIKLIVEHKADLNYVSCAAASILAKCVREELMAEIRQKYGECGSGYPSDPLTQSFLAKNWEKHPEIFRKSWASYKKFSATKDQKEIGEF